SDVSGEAEGDIGFDDPPLPPPASSPPPPPDCDGEQTSMPVHVVRFGVVRACVWLNHTEFGPRHHVTVSRLYKGSDGRWCSSESFVLLCQLSESGSIRLGRALKNTGFAASWTVTW